MIEIVVCDDDRNDLIAVSQIIDEICRNEAINCNLKTYTSGKEMLSRTYGIDIGILDISMREMNGIDLGRELKKKFPDVKLIYTTSYEQYCQQVINVVHAFSFLTKPVKFESVRTQIIELLESMENDSSGRKREFYNVTASDAREIDVLKMNVKDILYFEYIKVERKIKMICNNEWYKFSYVMEKLAEELKSFGFEVNCRGMLVNMRHIRKVKGYFLHMDNGQKLALSQKRKADFVKIMNVFMNNNYN